MTSRSPCFLVFPVLGRLAPEGLVTHFSFHFCHKQEETLPGSQCHTLRDPCTPPPPAAHPAMQQQRRLLAPLGRQDWAGGAVGTPLFFLRVPGIRVGRCCGILIVALYLIPGKNAWLI